MKKIILPIASVLLFSGFISAQVGINTSDPKTTMDVGAKRDASGNITDNTQLLGIQAPRVTRGELTANTAAYGTDQRGALIYITDTAAGNTTGSRVNVDAVGYYYFDGTLWQKISGGPGSVNLYTSNGTLGTNRTVTMADKTLAFTSAASTGTNHFSIDGTTFSLDAVNDRVGIGTDTPSQRLDVNGNARIRSLTDANSSPNYPRTVVAQTDGTLGYVEEAVTLKKQVYVADVADLTKTVLLDKFEFRLRDLANGTSIPEFRLTASPGSNISVFYHLDEKWNSATNNFDSNTTTGTSGRRRFITLEHPVNTANWSTWSPFNGTAANVSGQARNMDEFSATNISIQYANDPSVYVVDFKIIDIPNAPETYSILVQKY